MTSYPPPPPGSPGSPGFAGRIDEAIELIELEFRHAVAYFNDAVVPQVRHESIAALRTVSDKLRTLADILDRQSKWPPSGPSSGFPGNPAGNKDPRP
jgi:hypothetical protein